METENLNLMTRRELLDCMKLLEAGSTATSVIRSLLDTVPEKSASDPREDVYEVLFELGVVEEISLAVELHSYQIAEQQVADIEEDATNQLGDARFQYWQQLSEKWSYLELMLAMS